MIDDLTLGMKSTAIKFGSNSKLYLSSFALLMIASLLLAGNNSQQTFPYYASVAVTAAHLGYQVNYNLFESPSGNLQHICIILFYF